MSNYHRMSQLKNLVFSLKSFKNFNKLNEALEKRIDAVCNKANKLHESNGNIGKIKELNKLLTKGLSNAAAKLSTTANVSGLTNETVQSCRSKLQNSCKHLYTLPDTIKEKKQQYKTKYLKSKYVKKEAQKLSLYLTKKQLHTRTMALSATGISLQNGDGTLKAGTPNTIIDPIPEPPPIPDAVAEALSNLNELGEPTFISLGLGGWTPVGIVQNCMEYLHVTLGVDWWLAIMIGTIVIRICLFPLVIKAQRNAAKMNNVLPQMQALQLKMTEARQTGDALNTARYSQELMLMMREKGVNPLKNMLVPLLQAPIFLSFFMGLREMANVPVESLRHGGILWFQDLTLPDQYFLLPMLTSLTLWITIEIGADTAKASTQSAHLVKYVLRALPIVVLPFTINFPGVILCYWVSANFISMLQVSFLRIPAVRDYFNIEELKHYSSDQLPVKTKGFREGIKDSWTNIKITRELEDRRRLDDMQFRRAGKGPIQKTFKYDPTKPNNQVPISAKKR
ncbi:mitochondrial inner membrane protein OXA1L [Euwallacea fornicatus]|uniref:mitochondrial inner membrane protein OXA1L n=1 Tax=Euwallacea fornicatus TaxID=995702 RepID=UPI00338FE1E4